MRYRPSMPAERPADGAPRGFAIEPPIEPMLAKLANELPAGDGWLFEPKWDGFRAIVFRDGDRALHPEPGLRSRSSATSPSWRPAAGEPASALRWSTARS